MMLDNTVRYWLCCGSKVFPHGEKTCNEAELGHPENVRFGTANEHAEWGRMQALKDQVRYGMSVSIDGKRRDPASIYAITEPCQKSDV